MAETTTRTAPDAADEAAEGQERPRQNHRYLITSTWTGTLLLLVAIWSVATMLTGRDAAEALQRARRDTANLTRVVAEQTVRTIAGVDQILSFLSYDLSRLKHADPKLGDVLRHATQGSAVLLQLSFTDPEGTLIQTSVDAPPARVNLADREHFKVHKEGRAEGLFISRPVFGRASGRWSIQLSRRIDGDGGAFGGIVVASLDPFYFSHTFDNLDVGKQGAITIIGQDGILRARSVMDEKIIGQDLSGTSLFKTALERKEGFLRSASRIDGVTRLWGFRTVSGYPLMVLAGFSEDEFMADALVRRKTYLTVAAASTAALLAMALIVTWQTRGQQRALAIVDETALRLRGSEQRLRDIAETASDWFWEMDERLRFSSFSGSFDGLVAGRPSIVGCHIDEIAVREPGDGETWHRHHQTLTERAPFRHFEYAVRGADGDLRIWSLNGKPVFDGRERFRGYRGSGSDITERRRAERSLAASERRYRAMFAAVGQPIVVTDPAGGIVGFNPSAERLFGLGESEVLGRNVACLMPEDQAAAHPARIAAYRGSGRANPVSGLRELTARRADGTLVPIEIDLSSWHNDDGDFFIGIVRDISTTKQIQTELRRARDSAEQASRMKSEFLATVSHELRTPMNGVLVALDLLRREDIDPAAARRLTLIAHRSAEGLLGLLDDILDFSKLEAGQTTIEAKACAPAAVVGTVIDALGPRAAEKGIALAARMLPSMPEAVMTDPARLRQILFNLVGNALKFTAAGHVAVRGRRGADLGGDRFLLEFEVEDTGIGIDPAVLPTLFDSFTQADASITRRFGGTGLGLAISKELCQLLGGEISVVSAPGQGSVFRFTIACRAADQAGLPAPALPEEAPPTPALPRLLILAVDDNDINRETARALLELAGHSVVTAGGGREAIGLAAETRFDIVLMDLQMPEMDGLTATDRIRALPPPYGTVPVIAWTAHASASTRSECLAAGLSGFVTKPLRPAALFAEMAAVLSAGGSDNDAAAHDEPPPSPPDDDDHALLDRELVDILVDALGEEGWPSFVESFALSARTQIASLAEGLAAGADHRKLAHTLKGMAWSAGARRLGNAALTIEQGDREEASALASSLDETLNDTMSAFKEKTASKPIENHHA
ncbi:MAG: PAS domain S-box protein [Rhodospirillaceae bacterium]